MAEQLAVRLLGRLRDRDRRACTTVEAGRGWSSIEASALIARRCRPCGMKRACDLTLAICFRGALERSTPDGAAHD